MNAGRNYNGPMVEIFAAIVRVGPHVRMSLSHSSHQGEKEEENLAICWKTRKYPTVLAVIIKIITAVKIS